MDAQNFARQGSGKRLNKWTHLRACYILHGGNLKRFGEYRSDLQITTKNAAGEIDSDQSSKREWDNFASLAADTESDIEPAR